jgi:hypothetical protein
MTCDGVQSILFSKQTQFSRILKPNVQDTDFISFQSAINNVYEAG